MYAERALVSISSPSAGIFSIINRLAIDSIENPPLDNDLDTIITFTGELSGLACRAIR